MVRVWALRKPAKNLNGRDPYQSCSSVVMDHFACYYTIVLRSPYYNHDSRLFVLLIMRVCVCVPPSPSQRVRDQIKAGPGRFVVDRPGRGYVKCSLAGKGNQENHPNTGWRGEQGKDRPMFSDPGTARLLVDLPRRAQQSNLGGCCLAGCATAAVTIDAVHMVM